MKLSIGMMVKNEAHNLERCLQSLQPLLQAVDSELIIVDTGSEDDTVAISQQYTDKLYFHPWNNNFSEMRNITISYAQGEWFLVIDADEELQDTQPLIDFLHSPACEEYSAVAITCKNIVKEHDPKDYAVISTLRLFKNDGFFHYEGAVHNQQVFKGEALQLPVTLLHYGYMLDDQELMDRKFIRTGTILRAELKKDPNNIYYWYQLSATYAMHNDVAEAVEYIEKAYKLFNEQQKPLKCMFVFTHMALMYQVAGNYQKVEEVCLESLTIKTGYLDIYYYLAEAQALLGKAQESIGNYNKYLDLLKNYEYLAEKDTSIIEYTMKNEQISYRNLVNMYRHVGNYAQALLCSQKLTDLELIRGNMENIIFLYIKLEQYEELATYYAQIIKDEWHTSFYEQLEAAKRELDTDACVKVAEVFCHVDDAYGLLSTMVLEETTGGFSPETLDSIQQLDFLDLPLYCSPILYYLLKGHYPLEKVLTHFKEMWLSCLVDDLGKKYDDLRVVLYEYLQEYTPANNMSAYKLSKALCRYVLILDEVISDKLASQNYQAIFERYTRDGIAYLQLVYHASILDKALVYEVKNDEEVFLLYMHHAQLHKNLQQAQYLTYLRQALVAFPLMKKGIEMLLTAVQVDGKSDQDELENYKIQIKNTIKQRIAKGQQAEAQAIMSEYSSIVPNDEEILLFQSQLALPMTDVGAVGTGMIGKKKIIFFVKPGLDSFLGDVITGLSEEYETKKVIVNEYHQIDEERVGADICWFEWCDDLLIYASHLPQLQDKKVICRLHSYEAFTDQPLQVNWCNVDQVIFVAEHIRQVVLKQVSTLNQEQTVVIANGIDVGKYHFAQRAPGFKIAYVGYINYKKGPMLLLHAFKAIVDQDQRYKLYIAGTFQDERDVLYYQQMIQELGLEQNVIYDGWQDNIDQWLEDKHYILCTSLLESQNMSVMQAMAKGIKPIIHNFVGAKNIYPESYRWNTIEQASNMVINSNYNSMEYHSFINNNYSLTKELSHLRNLLGCDF